MLDNSLGRQWIATFTCCLSASMVATCFVWTAPLLRDRYYSRMSTDDSYSLRQPFPNGYFSIVVPAGAAIFSFPASIFADWLGRKPTLLMASPSVFIGWAMLVFEHNNLFLLYIGSVIHGFAAAVVLTVGPVYLAEISECGKRGLFSGQFQVSFLVGIVYAYTVGSIFPDDPLRSYIGILMVLPIVALVTFFIMPESPYFLLMTAKNEQAIDALQWLRGSEDVIPEYTLMKGSVEKEIITPRRWNNLCRWNDLVATTSDQRSLSIVVLLSALRSLSSMAAVPVFIFYQLSVDDDGKFSTDAMAINLTVVTVICSFAASLAVDLVGRKPILVVATIGSTVFSSIMAIFYSLETTVDSHSWIKYIALVGLSVSHNVGLGGIIYTVQAEYFPCKTRALAGGLSTFIFGLLNSLGLLTYQILGSNDGTFLYYVIYTLIAVLGVAVVPVAYHESAGRTLSQMQEIGICRKKSEKTIFVIE